MSLGVACARRRRRSLLASEVAGISVEEVVSVVEGAVIVVMSLMGLVLTAEVGSAAWDS